MLNSGLPFTRSVGENESAEDGKSSRERIGVFKTWFGENIMPTLQGSDSIMMLPFGPHQTVHYRDDLPQCVDNYPNCMKDSVHACS